MRAMPTALPDVVIIEPQFFGDARGFFFESFNARRFAQATGSEAGFVQDTHARAPQGVLRGLHAVGGQGCLMRATAGEIWAVAVDLRRPSATCGHWVGVTLSVNNRRQLWIPPGFAHGHVVLSEFAEVVEQMTAAQAPLDARCIRWDDPTLAIDWPFDGQPLQSAEDAAGLDLAQALRD